MATASIEYQTLLEYVKGKPDGFSLDYDLVERETGIEMKGQKGRRLLSKAIIKSGRRYLIFPGLGYQLDDVKNTMQIVDIAGIKVTRQIVRSSKTTRVVTIRHSEQLETNDQKRLKAINFMYNFLERKSTQFEEITIKPVKEIPPPNIQDRK